MYLEAQPVDNLEAQPVDNLDAYPVDNLDAYPVDTICCTAAENVPGSYIVALPLKAYPVDMVCYTAAENVPGSYIVALPLKAYPVDTICCTAAEMYPAHTLLHCHSKLTLLTRFVTLPLEAYSSTVTGSFVTGSLFCQYTAYSTTPPWNLTLSTPYLPLEFNWVALLHRHHLQNLRSMLR